jgi:hypothetical protein
MKQLTWINILLLSFQINSQELFPNNEPASNIPKGVIGVREFNETYRELNTNRNLFGLRLMYGLLPKLTVMGSASASNHHDKNFPVNLVSHTHSGNQTTYSTGNFQRGIPYSYQYNGIYLFAKYRFFTRDGQNKHLRIAAYADWSNVKVAHDEAEPTLLDDTRGYGAGIITTVLNNRFAASFTGGFIIPGSYTGFSPDPLGGPMISTEVRYGRAVKYNLSFGYLLLPFHYASYKQTNLNIYLELQGKSFEKAKVYQYGGVVDVPIQTPLLEAGNYVEAHPGLQLIFNSNLRIDFSAGLPFINRSYTRFYPVYMIAFQRYFYLKK